MTAIEVMDIEQKQSDPQENENVELDPESLKKLVRKIDLWLMPSIWIIYLLSYVVRKVVKLCSTATNFVLRIEVISVLRRSPAWKLT